MVWYGSCMDPPPLLHPLPLGRVWTSSTSMYIWYGMVWYGMVWILYGPCSTSSLAHSDFCWPSNNFPIYLHFFSFLMQKGTLTFEFWSQYTFSPYTSTTYTTSFFFPLLAPINIFCFSETNCYQAFFSRPLYCDLMMQEDILHLSIFFWNICGFYFFFCVFGMEKFVVRSTMIAGLPPPPNTLCTASRPATDLYIITEIHLCICIFWFVWTNTQEYNTKYSLSYYSIFCQGILIWGNAAFKASTTDRACLLLNA